VKRLVAPLVAIVALFGLGGTTFAATSVNTSTTPGATDPAATQQTVCDGALPSTGSVSSATKRQVFAAYHVTKKQQRRYVVDHLVPAALGGSNDAANLWPHRRGAAKGKASQVAAVRLLVCQNEFDLAAAQQAFQSNWQTARKTAESAAAAHKAAIAQYVAAVEQAKKDAIAQYVAAVEQAKQAEAAAAAQAAAEQHAQQQHQSCPNGTYVNSAGNTVCSPFSSPSGPPAGATAQCRDGTYSFSQSRSGTCSSHGGVAQWL
jgi:hypothetical protein